MIHFNTLDFFLHTPRPHTETVTVDTDAAAYCRALACPELPANDYCSSSARTPAEDSPPTAGYCQRNCTGTEAEFRILVLVSGHCQPPEVRPCPATDVGYVTMDNRRTSEMTLQYSNQTACRYSACRSRTAEDLLGISDYRTRILAGMD